MNFASLPTVYFILFFISGNNGNDQDNEVSECGSPSDMISEDEHYGINSDGCTSEVASDMEANVCGFDDGDENGRGDCGGDDGGGRRGGGSDSASSGDDNGGGSGGSNDDDRNKKEEIVSCILRGLILAEEMKASVKSMENVLEFAKDLYCKGDSSLEKHWPSNWRNGKVTERSGLSRPQTVFHMP